jgi:hypothetical protein
MSAGSAGSPGSPSGAGRGPGRHRAADLVAKAGVVAREAPGKAAVGAALRDAAKTTGWRMRAKVGRRIRWYQTPEEIAR